MAVYKEINRADGSGVTTFYRISDILDTAETDDKESQSVVIDYNQAQNKPSINGVALVGNKTSENLGLQPAGDYITNNEADEKFIDEDELEAKNYVNQTELQDAIAHIEHFHREIVEALPVTGMDNVLYMVRKGGTGGDIYNEYIWVGLSNSENGYEFLGTTATDLTDYYKKSQVDAALATKVDKEGGKGLSEENYTLAEKTKLAGLKNYDDTEIQAEVSGLNTDINNLKKSNVTISNTLAELKPDVDSNTAAVSTIYDLLDNKMTAIRLVEQGDGWVWMNLEGSRLTYAQASAALGHENCMLFIEQLENDGKVIPAEYKSDGDHINVIFKDLDSLVHIMTCGEDDVVVTKDVTTTNGQVDFTVEDEAIGYTTKMTALYGKSTQETRSGKNLLPNDATSTTISGITYTINSDGTIKVNGTASADSVFYLNSTNITIPSGTYTFNGCPSNGSWDTYSMGFGGYNDSGNGTTFTLNTDYSNRAYIRIANGYNANNLLFKPMISTSGGEYEPYGVMPSPEYPSPIESITEISVTVTGKNLFNKYGDFTYGSTNNRTSLQSDGTILSTSNFGGNRSSGLLIGNIKSNTDYTISGILVSADGTSIKNNAIIQVLTASNTPIKYCYINTSVTKPYNFSFTFNSGENTSFWISLNGWNSTGEGTTNTIFDNIQLEEGTQATSYEEYKSNSLTINLQGNELCSIGDVKDELIVENGIAKIIKRIGRVVLDGSESWRKAQIGTTGKYYFTFTPNWGQQTTNGKLLYCDYFVPSNTWSEQVVGMWLDTNMIIKTQGSLDNTEDLTSFKTWLSTHNVEVYYALETPIDIEITDPTLLAQLNALEQITQYKHTYITITGNDLTPEADFTYINNVVINNTDSVLGKDTYWNDEVPTQQDLPSKAQEGEIRIVQDTEDVYIYNGTKWVPFDKNSEVDLSNYLTKDNTTPWVPTGPFNPSTKKYVDDSVGGIHVPTKTSQLQNDSNFVIKTTNELTNYYTKNNTYTKNEVDALVASGSGTSDYSDLTNKPKINNVELSGNKSSSDLGITNLNNVLDGNAIGSARTIGAKDSEGQPLGEYAWAEGKNTTASGTRSHAEGGITKASGDYSHAEGWNTKASGDYSHAEGISTTASGIVSHAEGDNTTASGTRSHAEGGITKASGDYSHAEGASTTASGQTSHAEGNHTTASGTFSHAEGDHTTASGTLSHAEGTSTTAQGNIQHVQGKFNIADTTSAHIVGNGSSISNKSNAHTLDWSGNAWFAGDVYTGSTSGKNKDDGSKKLATEEFVTNLVGNVESGSNSEGSWIKYSDGSMICYKTIIATGINVDNPCGNLYENSSAIQLGNFAQTFKERPIVSLNKSSGQGC